MTADHQADRGSGWEAMQRTLAADAVVAEGLLYASGSRRLTVEHGQPLTGQAAALVQQLVDDVDAVAGYLGGGSSGVGRSMSITWTSPSTGVPARRLVSLRLGCRPTRSARTGGSAPTATTHNRPVGAARGSGLGRPPMTGVAPSGPVRSHLSVP